MLEHRPEMVERAAAGHVGERVAGAERLPDAEVAFDVHVGIRTRLEQQPESLRLVVHKRPQKRRHVALATGIDVGPGGDELLHPGDVVGRDGITERDHLRVSEEVGGFPAVLLMPGTVGRPRRDFSHHALGRIAASCQHAHGRQHGKQCAAWMTTCGSFTSSRHHRNLDLKIGDGSGFRG